MTDTGGQTPLERLIRWRIAQEGGLSVAEYMHLCLSHPEHGYYTTRQPFGASGDFITAPEASQMFGELVGAWAAACWQRMGGPRRLHLVELGPGRGLLMQDLLRAARSWPEFHRTLTVHMVEISPHLRAEQKERLANAGIDVRWHERMPEAEELGGDGPVIVIANEFFDALPVHHYERTKDGWRERLVVIGDNGRLAFAPVGKPLENLPEWAVDVPVGGVIELSPERADMARGLARLIAARGGVALVFDYGHVRPGAGETLQALHRHERVDVFFRPGEADITAHVDFAALADAFREGGLVAPAPMVQGAFLLALGLQQRLRALLARANDAQAARLVRGAERIAGREQMGGLFKVLCAHHSGMSTPVPFSPAGA